MGQGLVFHGERRFGNPFALNVVAKLLQIA